MSTIVRGIVATATASAWLVGALAAPAAADTRELRLVTNEIKWTAKPGEAAVLDRTRGPVREIERYTFEPGFIVVKEGDRVVLHIHALKGSKHVVEVSAFQTGETQILRGEEKTVTFVASQAGLFEIRCTIHEHADEEGPMVGYLYVMGK